MNSIQELIFALALQNSTHEQLQRLAEEHLRECLPDFIQLTFDGTNNDRTILSPISFFFVLKDNGLADLSVEVLHAILLVIQSNRSVISRNDREKFLERLRKGSMKTNQQSMIISLVLEFPKERLGNNGSIVLLPLLYPSHLFSSDLTSSQLTADSTHLSTSVVRE